MFTSFSKIGRKIDPFMQNYITRCIKLTTDNIIKQHAFNNEYKNINTHTNIIASTPSGGTPPNLLFFIIGILSLSFCFGKSNMFSYSKYINEQQK